MAFDGYFRYDGVEIINSARTGAYETTLNLGFFNGETDCPIDEALAELGWSNSNYGTPGTKNTAPWYDPLEPSSAGFAGVVALDVQNIASTTYSATVAEAVTDGGWISRGRYGTRSMVFRALLVGTDMLAVQHGLNWLTTVLRNGDPCRRSLRTRHTYYDFLPYGKPWWTSYKSTSTTARPDNVWQANRYLGLSTTDDAVEAPGDTWSGNTYAKLHSGGTDGFSEDALGLLVKLDSPDPLSALSPTCHGNTLEYFIDCPTPATAHTGYRRMTGVELTSGPTVLGERNIGGPRCRSGAWLEVEFTLIASNPFAWREPRPLGLEDPEFKYGDIPTKWAYYKETADLPSDNDVYQAPLVASKPQTYKGFFDTVWALELLPPLARDRPAVHASPSGDPLCPPLPQFPAIPQEHYLCPTISDVGPYQTKRYAARTSALPNFSPAAVKITVAAINAEYRDVRVRIIPQGLQDDPLLNVDLHILYLAGLSTIVIDGARRSIDLLKRDDYDNSKVVWEPAEHLVVTHGSGSSYRYPEIVCGKSFMVEVGIPVGQDPDLLNVTIEAVLRDG